MRIQLLNTSDEINKVDKTFTVIGDYNATLKDEVSILRPSLLISSNNVINCNYVYIPEFNRYYWASITSVRQGLWRIDCDVDVLMSWSSYIKNLNGIIERQENEWNLLQQDEMFKVYQDPMVSQIRFPKSFGENGGKYILTLGA